MAYSYTEYTGDGSTVAFNIPFSYIDTTDVTVEVNGSTVSATISGSTATCAAAPANGTTVRVKRRSGASSRKVDYANGGTLTEADLDNDSKQAFYRVQELADDLEELVAGTVTDGSITAAKLGASAVETAKIDDEAVTAAKLGPLAVETAKLAANAVTNAKLAQIATRRLKGRTTASTGDVEDVNPDDVKVVADNATAERDLSARFAERSNVLDWGADPTGAADCSVAFQNAINTTTGDVIVPPGVYRFTSGLTISNGKRLIGLCGPGGANANANLCTLRHDFDGTFITFDGATGTNRGAGGGLENLILEQYYGNSGAARGRAVHISGTTTDLRANWVRIKNCQIENASGKDKWTWGIDIDGSVVGGTDGVRDMWVESTRVVGDTTGGGIRITTGFNVWLIGVECNLTGSDIKVTGAVGAKSASVFLVGCSADVLDLDYAQLVYVSGGSFTTISTTSNCDTVIANPSFLGSIPASLPGADVVVSCWDDEAARMVTRVAGNTAMLFGRDKGAGDSTNLTQVGVGNQGSDEGAIFLRYTNAAAAGGPVAGIYVQPRNNADASNFNGGSLHWDKVGGQDKCQATMEWGGGTLVYHQDGYAYWNIPVRVGSYNDGTRPAASSVPAGAMIWNTGDNAPNFSDGTDWRTATGAVT